jgi:2',3'-cyclic-nucleotide 2'-phosphodiesterase (5'-nucleotidase family)
MSVEKSVTILQLNDSHGYFKIHPELFWEGNREVYRRVGGYSRISTIFNQIREEYHGTVIALDNGDTIHGTYGAVNNEGQDLTPILNNLAFDGTRTRARTWNKLFPGTPTCRWEVTSNAV